MPVQPLVFQDAGSEIHRRTGCGNLFLPELPVKGTGRNQDHCAKSKNNRNHYSSASVMHGLHKQLPPKVERWRFDKQDEHYHPCQRAAIFRCARNSQKNSNLSNGKSCFGHIFSEMMRVGSQADKTNSKNSTDSKGQRAMEKNGGNTFDRREVLKTSAMAVGGLVLAGERTEAFPKGVNTNSSPSKLKITDLRVATLVKPGPSPCPIIRIDTDQGVYGLGEVRDGASATYALFLKSRILGEDPLKLDKIFRKIKQFGGHARQGGGVSAIEMALWDITGKVYKAPVCAMIGGGKFRDKVRIYADTEESKDPKIYAQRMKERKEGMGVTWLKMDLGIEMVADTPGTVTGPSELTQWEENQLEHPLLAMEVTDKGIAMLEQ